MGMGCLSFFCSTTFLVSLLILSAIPISIIVYLERTPLSSHVYQYHSKGWLRETAKWDDLNRRFLVSCLEGGVAEIRIPDDAHESVVLEEITAVKDADLAGNASMGMTVDRQRNRLLVVAADLFGKRYGGLVAYDLSSWHRLFLTHLTAAGDEKSFAEDVAVDEEGNAYVTDAEGSKIWKVSEEGKLLSVIRSPLFRPKEWYKNLVGLNGIVYHPNGYLLAIHTFSGNLYKIDLNNGQEDVKLVKVIRGSLKFGDGLGLLSPTKLVVAGKPSGRLVESVDDWETASVVGTYSGPPHRLPTSVTVKDGKAYLNHAVGLGYPKRKHIILEAIFA